MYFSVRPAYSYGGMIIKTKGRRLVGSVTLEDEGEITPESGLNKPRFSRVNLGGALCKPWCAVLRTRPHRTIHR